MVTRSTEHSEQCAVFQYIRYKALSDWRYKLFAAIPNGGARHPLVALKISKEGGSRGVPDIMAAIPSKTHHGLFIEMKVKPNRCSKEQKEWIDNLNRIGYCAVVCWSATEAIKTIDEYMINAVGSPGTASQSG